MIVPVVGCILAGCLQDVPYIVGDPVLYYLTPTPKERIDKSQYSCYVNGEFWESLSIGWYREYIFPYDDPYHLKISPERRLRLSE